MRAIVKISDGQKSYFYFVPKDEAAKLRKKWAEYKLDSALPGELVKELRTEAKLTQRELAEKISVAQGDVSAIESGRRPVGSDIARRLSEVFGVEYSVFLQAASD